MALLPDLRRSRWARTLATPVLTIRQLVSGRARRRQYVSWDRLADLLSEDPVIRVPEFSGDFQMDVRSHLFQRLALDGSYESHLVGVCKRYAPQHRDAIDVGANAGLFSVLLAALVPERRVLAVEPSPAMVARLRANVRRNGLGERVEIFEGALAEAEGTAQLQAIEGLEEYGTLGTLSHPALQGLKASQSETVQTTSLDALVASHALAPGFIKIDVEGAEARVIRGALETLRVHRPAVLTELDHTLLQANGSSARDVIGMLHQAGYDLFDPASPDLVQLDPSDPLTLTEALCLPRERST